MDINTLAAWGEFIGGIAVVVSLVYLAFQIKQNSRLLRASTATVTQQVNDSTVTLVVQDPELTRIYWEGLADRNALPEEDLRRFDPLLAIGIGGHQQHFRLQRDGLLSAEQWQDQDQAYRWLVQQPGMRQWWLQWGGKTYSGDFRAYFDGLIREGEAAG